MLTHLPLRSWCDHCMKGKIREDGHFKRNPGSNPSEVPRVSMDYCYLGRVLKPVGRDNPIEDKIEDLRTAQDEDEGTVPVLVITDEKTGCVFAGAVAKGVNAYALHLVTEALKFTGRQKVILLTDAEHSIRALAEAAAKEWGKECQLQVAPRESRASNGAAERAILELARQARTLVSGLEHHFPEFKMLPTHKTYSWIIRHAAWLLTRYLVKLDGRTPYERLRGREYRGEIAEGFETVHYKVASTQKGKLDPQSAIGVWLGKSLMSDEHLIGTDQGIRRCRSIWRRPENKRWEKKTFEGFIHRHCLHRALLEEDGEVSISPWRFRKSMVRLQGVQAVSRHMISQSRTVRNAGSDLMKSLAKNDSSLRVVPRLRTGPRVAPRPQNLRVEPRFSRILISA